MNKRAVTISNFGELSLHDLYALLRLRSEVFVVEQDCVYLDIDGRDEASTHVLLKEGSRLVAYARIVPPGLQFDHSPAIGRVCSTMSHRRAGAGREVFAKALEHCLSLFPDCPPRLQAQSYLLDFYRNFGFVIDGEEYLEDGIPHHDMRLERAALSDGSH